MTEPERIAEDLSPVLGHRFASPDLLLQALTHASAVPAPSGRDRKNKGTGGYERLEFLGDRVLGLVVAEMLWRRFPEEAEGALTRRHTQLVRGETLAEIAAEIDLGRHIILSPGEDAARTREAPGVLADVCEAMIAALYLDGGLPAASGFIERYWEKPLLAAAIPPRDAKTALQEWAQGRGFGLPRYETVKTEGPAHERRFTVTVAVPTLPVRTATGSSKRSAEMAAAGALLAQIAQQENTK